MTPTSSKRAWVGSKPDSSASTPKMSEPPFFGVFLDTPLRPGPLVDGAGDAVEPSPSAPMPPPRPRPPLRRPPAASDDRISRPSVLHFPEPSGPPEGSRATLVPRIPLRGGGTRGLRVGRLGSAGLFRLAGRTGRGHPEGLRERRHAPSPNGWPAATSRAPRASTACTCGATWPPSGRGSWPGPPSPARRRRCAATSPGRCRQGRLGSDPARSLRAPLGRRAPAPRACRAGEVASLLDVADRDRGGPPRPGRPRAAVRGRAARLGALRPRPGRHRPARPDGDGARARGASSAGCRSTTPRSTRWRRGSTDGRDEMDGPPEAAFVNRRGARLGPAGRPAHPRPPRRLAHPPPRPAPHLRHPPPRRGRRPAGRPGAPGPRQPGHHPGVHPRQQGATARRVRGDPPPGLSPRRSLKAR